MSVSRVRSLTHTRSITHARTIGGTGDGGGGGGLVADVTLTKGAAALVSAYKGGYVQVQSELVSSGNNAGALTTAYANLEAAMQIVNRHIKGWGTLDMWAVPGSACPVWNAGHGATADSRWDNFDTYITACKVITDAVGGDLVLTLHQCPWWMMGNRVASNDSITGSKCKVVSDSGSDFSSHTLTTSKTRTDRDSKTYTFPVGYVNPDMKFCRVLDDQLDNWATLCYHCARRAMHVYGVRKFVVWNELKGYFHPSDGTTNSINMDKGNTWDGGLSAGTTGDGHPHAEHGYTYMYNKVYAQVAQAATDEGISRGNWMIGGPYVSHALFNSSGAGGFPTSETGMSGDKYYGYHDDRTLAVVRYFTQHATGYDWLILRSSLKCQDINTDENGASVSTNHTSRGHSTYNIYRQTQLYQDLVTWCRNVLGVTVPIENAEYYLYQNPASTSTQYHASIVGAAMHHWIMAGGESMWRWGYGTTEDGINLLSSTSGAGGGVATPSMTLLQHLATAAPAGAQLYTPTITDGTSPTVPRISALVSDTHVHVVNQAGATLNVDLSAFGAGVVALASNTDLLVSYS